MEFALLPLLLLLLSFTKADDLDVMSKFAASISPAPESWTGNAFCNWSGVNCSNGRVTDVTLKSKSLAGTLPSNLNSLSELITLSLQGNRFSGEIPSFQNLSKLRQIYLDNNDFTSISSTAFSGLTSLEILLISTNPNLAPWTFPSELIHSNHLQTLSAESCNLIGPIPDFFDSLPELSALMLSYNRLTGVVPPSLTASPNLRSVTLQFNKLQGPYPAFNSTVTTKIGTSNNFCTNKPGAACAAQVRALIAAAGAFDYPISLAESWTGNDPCRNNWMFITCHSNGNFVNSVNLARQNLNGTISSSFADLDHLETLFLNDNNLIGSIPENLTTLAYLQSLDVSNNNLTGQLPKFRAGVTVNYTGNSIINETNSTGQDTRSGGSSKNPVMVIGLVVGVLALVGLVGLLGLYRFKRGDHNPGLGSETVSEGGNVVIPIQVLRQATNNFTDDNILGEGGFGVVYGGKLENGKMIAVKRMKASSLATKGMKEFQAEIGVLTKVRHRHLVALLGYCFNEEEKILVYEYMPQGTLMHHLFKWQELGVLPLTWRQRMIIALDVGRGVEYLHSLAQLSFIHRDLKPSNILLGNDMRAKVADFGLVKIAPEDNQSIETRVAGTFGYIDPVYGATGRVTTKVDVYAFGVILMEMITGRKAIDNSLQEESWDLVTWFRKMLTNNGKDGIRDVMDDSLDVDDEAYDSVLRVAELAGHCTTGKPYQRPDMGHAVNVLASLVDQWIPVSPQEEGEGEVNFSQINSSYSSFTSV